MVELKNNQRAVDLNLGDIKKDARHLLALTEYSDFGLGIQLTTQKKIQAFNKKFRNKNQATDILSFPFYPDLKPGEKIILSRPNSNLHEEKYLGDIIICPEFAKEDLPNWHPQTFEQRLRSLLVHGICHLLGYTHDTEENETIMRAKEAELLEKLKKNK